MGRFFDIVPPFSTEYSQDIYVYDDNSVSAPQFVHMVGFNSIEEFSSAKEGLDRFVKKREPKRHPRGGKENNYFIDIDDMPTIMKELDRDPEDLKKVFHAKITIKVKRDREEEGSDFIKEFAKRFITEHPEEAKNIVISNLVTKKIQEIIKKLEN